MNINKVEIGKSHIYRLLYPRNTILVSCIDSDGKANIITLAWSMPVSIDPPMVAISVSPKRYSHKLIEETKEFVINIPTMDILEKTAICGKVSGKDCEKFEKAKLTPTPAKSVKPPLIEECIAHLECKLVNQSITGDHTLFIGKVVKAHVDEKVFYEGIFDLKKAKLIYHVGGDRYTSLTPEIMELSI
ncbi:MAG: flavin reductase family protein [Candidatus Bathyarchaeia archaeon]